MGGDQQNHTAKGERSHADESPWVHLPRTITFFSQNLCDQVSSLEISNLFGFFLKN